MHSLLERLRKPSCVSIRMIGVGPGLALAGGAGFEAYSRMRDYHVAAGVVWMYISVANILGVSLRPDTRPSLLYQQKIPFLLLLARLRKLKIVG